MPLGIGPLELIIALVVTLAVIGLIKAVLRGAVKMRCGHIPPRLQRRRRPMSSPSSRRFAKAAC